MVNLIPPHSTRVLDLACGTGISTRAIATRFPNSTVVGVELRDEYLDIARKKAQAMGLRNMEFVLSRAEDYRSCEPFDCVSSSDPAKYAELDVLIPSLKEMLKPDGLLIMQRFYVSAVKPIWCGSFDCILRCCNWWGARCFLPGGRSFTACRADRTDPVGSGTAGRVGDTRI